MPKRTICIQNPASLSVKHSSLVISQDGRVAEVSLEDIWVVILETHHAQVSTAAMSRLMDEGIGLMVCGHDHMPNGLLLPLGAHSRHAQIVENQLAMSKPFCKRLWQQIVVAKIENQALALEYLGQDGSAVRLSKKEVLSGDTSNRESVAASAYFRRLFAEGTRREGPYTNALDYGYAVLRAGVGRTAVSGGWLVSRGIHHSSNLNAFNLVDDLIEPFRPLVDLLVMKRELSGELTPESKRELASIFEYQVFMDGERLGLQAAIELELDSLKTAVLNGDPKKLVLPGLLPLERTRFE